MTIPGVLAALLVGGCGGAGASADGAGGGAEVEPFPGSASSLDALGRGVLRALVAGDMAALERVRLTAGEHNEAVWPELPAARAEVGFPVDLAWQNIERRNARDLRRLSPWYRGRELRFLALRCRGDTRPFRTFRVHTDCWVRFADAERGALEAQLFKDVLERGGGFKVFRFDADRAPRGAPVAAGAG